MAAADSFQTEPASFDESEPFHRFQRVLGAAWGVSTRWRCPLRGSLVEADQSDADSFSHLDSIFWIAEARSFRIFSNSTLSAEATAVTIKSRFSLRPHCITAARIRRFRRLRRAMHPKERGVAIPIRPGPGRAEIRQKSPRTRLPSRKISSNRAFERLSLMGQPGAAAQPPTFDHVAPVGRFHANAKSVGGLLVPVIGLIRTFHAWSKLAVL